MKRQVLTAMAYATVLGGLAGIVWGLALGNVTNGLIIGVLAGLLVGAALGVMGGWAVKGGMEGGEAMFVSGSLLAPLAVVSIGLGVVVWLVRVIFF